MPGLAQGTLVNSVFRVTPKNITPEDTDLVHFTFKVGKNRLIENNMHKWAVVLNRYDNDAGRWVELPTKWSAEDEGFVYYTATTLQLSTFAITGREQVRRLEWEVRELKISPASAEAGRKVTVSATVVNLSEVEATFAVPLWVNDGVEASQLITLVGGSQWTMTHTLVREEAGVYMVRVDRLYGRLCGEGAGGDCPHPHSSTHICAYSGTHLNTRTCGYRHTGTCANAHSGPGRYTGGGIADSYAHHAAYPDTGDARAICRCYTRMADSSGGGHRARRRGSHLCHSEKTVTVGWIPPKCCMIGEETLLNNITIRCNGNCLISS